MTHKLQVELTEDLDHVYSSGVCEDCGGHIFEAGRESTVRHETDLEIDIVMKHERVEKSKTKDLLMWLDDQELISMVHDNLKDDGRPNSIDFVVGDDWPDPFDDDHLNAIRRSSLGFMMASVQDYYDETFITEAVVHLPPAPEELQDDIDTDLPDCFAIHYGTRALGGMPAPDGVVTPHVQATRSVTFQEIKEVTAEVLSIYEDVYNCGERAIKTKP